MLPPPAAHEVLAVPALPRTLSGKSLEIPIKRVLIGTPPDQVASRDSLANRDALDWFTEFAATRHANPAN